MDERKRSDWRNDEATDQSVHRPIETENEIRVCDAESGRIRWLGLRAPSLFFTPGRDLWRDGKDDVEKEPDINYNEEGEKLLYWTWRWGLKEEEGMEENAEE